MQIETNTGKKLLDAWYDLTEYHKNIHNLLKDFRGLTKYNQIWIKEFWYPNKTKYTMDPGI